MTTFMKSIKIIFLKTRAYIKKEIQKPLKVLLLSILDNPRNIAVIFLAVAVIVIALLDYFYFLNKMPENWIGFIASVHGIFFDCVIFALIGFGLYGLFERRNRITHYQEELEDFCFWENREGILRKEAIIKRLSRLNAKLPDIKGIVLDGADLRNCNLSRACFAGARLLYVNFSKSILNGVSFISTQFDDDGNEQGKDIAGPAVCTGAMFSGSELNDAKLSGIDFSGLNCERASFRRSTLTGASFKNASLKFARFENAHLENVNFEGSDLYQASLRDAQLTGGIFSTSKEKPWDNGACANLTHADLSNINLTNAQLSYTNMSHSILENAVLYKAKLKSTNLGYSKLNNAVFKEADLEGADFLLAEIKGVDFSKANLRNIKNLTLEQIKEVKSFYLSGLDTNILEMITKNGLSHLLTIK
jgi:uncharacterized protein YjbI with pentapeptide repeats